MTAENCCASRRTGGDETVLLSEANTVLALPASCANGKYIVFTWAGYHGSPFANIWRVDSDGTNPKQITNERDIRGPVCSPDGKWVYFRDWFSHEIKRASIDGGKAEVVPGTNIPDADLTIRRTFRFRPMASGWRFQFTRSRRGMKPRIRRRSCC